MASEEPATLRYEEADDDDDDDDFSVSTATINFSIFHCSRLLPPDIYCPVCTFYALLRVLKLLEINEITAHLPGA